MRPLLHLSTPCQALGARKDGSLLDSEGKLDRPVVVRGASLSGKLDQPVVARSANLGGFGFGGEADLGQQTITLFFVPIVHFSSFYEFFV
jgi:hypothetical protein